MTIIHADKLTKVYEGKRKGAVTALDCLSLDVHDGEIFGLLGPNGAGKTTFIKVLLEIVFPTSGSATLLGKPIGHTDAKSEVGYLPENHRYPDFLTGEQVLSYFGKLSGLAAETLGKRIDEVLALVDMTQWRKTKIRKYSKGMLQRIGLAQALINNPRLVILDEPTDGVDPIGRKAIRDVLVRLRNEGKSVFVNSHLLSEVELICDRVAILDKGKLVRLGSVEELTTRQESYSIGIHGTLPDNLLVHWEATRMDARLQDGELHLRCDDVTRLNSVIDQLREANVLITSLRQQRQSLEDMFIEVISGEKAE
ncbi:MAG: ABC transporter ATP-binding protein [Bacteroidia bacterium]|nr:ABC transporter ATP-binding protein [Bacteroidia bacterium]